MFPRKSTLPKTGDTVDLTDKDGNKTTVTVQAVNADGYEVTDGNRVWMMPADEMRNAMTPKVENAQANVAENTTETATNGTETEANQAANQANEIDTNGHHFIMSSNGSTVFGQITQDSGLTAAPIKLSEGFNVVDEDGNNHGYGLLHIEAKHGQQILEAGYASVKDFVEDVTRNYQEIRIARSRKGNDTFMLLELHDEKHKRTLYVELSNDGTYWNVNSGGIFKNKYTDKNDIVWPEPTVGSNANTDTAEVVDSPTKVAEGETVDRGGNSSQPISSAVKVNDNSESAQENAEKKAEKGILIDKNGKKVYDQSPVEATVLDLYDGALDDEEIAEFVNANIAAAEKEVAKATAKKPKMGTDKEQYLAAKEKWNAAVTEAKRKAQYWNDVKAEIERITTPDESQTEQAEVARSKNESEQEQTETEQNAPTKVDAKTEETEIQGKAEEIKLSNEIDENGRQFVLTPDGNLAFGEIGKDTGLTVAPILLSEGMITNPKTNDGYGLVHIEARHGDQIRKAGFKSVIDFIKTVAQNYDVIKEGNPRDGHQTYRLQLTDRHNNTLMIELSGDGTYWNINTAGIFKTSYGNKNKEVYNRHTTAKQSVETAETSQNAEQSGTQTSSRMNVPTHSTNKVTNNPSSHQEKGEKSERENGNQSGNQTERKPLSKRMRMACEAIAKAIGVDIEWVDHMDANGEYEQKGKNGRPMIRIALDAENPLSTVFGHEGTHAVRNLSEEAYQSLVAIARAVVGEEEWRKRYVGIRRRYRKYQLSEDGVTEEVVCDIVGEMITDRNMAEQIAYRLDHPTLSALRDIARKLWEAVKKMAGKGELTEQEQAIKDFADTIERAFAEASAVYKGEGQMPSLKGMAIRLKQAFGNFTPQAMPIGRGVLTGDADAPSRYSIRQIISGVGLTVNIGTDGKVTFAIGNRTFDKEHHLQAEDIMAIDSPLTKLVDKCVEIGSLKDADVVYEKYTDFLNAILDKGDHGFEYLSSQWAWAGEALYKSVSNNSDAQYAKSVDITRVCKKNEAVINAICELQLQQQYGVTPGQILDLYNASIEEGYQVPCPVCYVFSRYIQNGQYASALMQGKKLYGHLIKDTRNMTEKQRKQYVQGWLDEVAAIQEWQSVHKKEIDEAKRNLSTILQAVDVLSEDITSGKLKGEAKTNAEKRIRAMSRLYQKSLDIVNYASLDGWITNVAIHKSGNEWVPYEDSYREGGEIYPDEVALDLRRAAEASSEYPGVERFRKSRGSAAGKTIQLAADNALGETAELLGIANPEKKDVNYSALQKAYAEASPEAREKFIKTFEERIAKARVYAAQQTLRGGIRQWSWSDNIERLSPDVFVNLLQIHMLGGAVQAYSKQLEGIELVASMNGYVNGSLMGKGIGYKEVDADFADAPKWKDEKTGKYYTLVFDNVVGIEPFSHDGKLGLFDLNSMYDRAGNILVGMDDIQAQRGLSVAA